ncbi:MAG: alpha/beta fold hydrolase [bacterium]
MRNRLTIPRRWALGMLVGCLVPSVTHAAPVPTPGDVEVVTGRSGVLAQWLAVGPIRLPRHRVPIERLRQPLTGIVGGVSSIRPGRPVRVRAQGRERALPWRLVPQAQGQVDLRALLSMKPFHRYRAAFLGLVIEAPGNVTAHLTVGHDDGLAVWLNGRQVFADLTQRSYRFDQRLVPLPLVKGRNRLVLQLTHGLGRWRIQTRLTGPNHLPLVRSRARLRLLLPGAAAAGIRRVAAPLRIGLRRRVRAMGLELALYADAPAGALLPPGGRVGLQLIPGRGSGAPTGRHVLDVRRLAARGWTLALSAALLRRGRGEARWLSLRLGNVETRRLQVWRAPRLCKGLAAAEALLRGVKPGASVPESSLSSVAYQLQDLRRLLEAGDLDAGYLSRRLRTVARWARALSQGTDPFPALRGRIVKAYLSPLDGSYQPYSLYVPAGYSRRRSWPLYVMLHGMSCSHRQGLSQMLGTWMAEADEAKTPWWRYLRRPPSARVRPRALVLAPEAFGNSFYRHAGEVGVHRAIAEVVKHYRVDPRRVILVGHSMGGTGVLDLGLRAPHRFAGMVSLAGYPSRWIHDEIRRGPLQAWERIQAQRYSPQFWVANGRTLPLIAVHGTQDGPHKSQGLVQTYKRHRQRAALKLFELGHSVWRLYLDKGQVYQDTAAWITPARPKRVQFQTTSLRWNRSFWIQLDDRPQSGAWSRVSARVRQGNRVLLETINVDQLTLLLDRSPLKRQRPVTLVLDKQRLTVPWRGSLTVHRWRSAWRPGPRPSRPSGLRKTPGLAGPMDDLHHGAALVVYGTLDKAQEPALRRVALRLRGHGGASVRYPVKADHLVTAADRKRYHLILVGGPHANRETARYAKRLPIRVSRLAVELGRCRFAGADVGVRFIHPNPDAAGRYLLVVAGTTALGVLRQHLVPRYLPDYVVYDRTISRTQGHRVLGPHRKFLAAGYFDRRWRLPAGACRAAR